MKYTFAAIAAFAGMALAQDATASFDVISAPGEGAVLMAGETFTIMWEPAPSTFDSETVEIILLAGETQGTLQAAAEPVAEGVVNSAGAFDWDIPSDLGTANLYGLKIQLTSDNGIFQFSFPFEITPSEKVEEEQVEEEDYLPIANSTSTVTPIIATTDLEMETETDAPSNTSLPTTLATATATAAEESSSTTSEAADASSTVVAGSGAQAKAGTFALVGGLAVAMLAL